MKKSPCPQPEQLRKLLLGQLAPEQAANLENHVAACSPCTRVVDKLRVEDPLVKARRANAAVAGRGGQAGNRGQPLKGRPVEPMPTTPESEAHTEGVKAGAGSEPASPQYDFLAPPQSPDELGRLGPYRVLKVLGHGGMGVVFLAEDAKLGRTVALKAMLPEMALRPESKERFLREARAAAALEHDNIVAIHQVDEERGVPYLAMPFLKGVSLEDWIRRKEHASRPVPITLREILKVGREIARGLAAAHARGLIHRDIKPANVWLDATAGGRVKILDFGLARDSSGDQTLTQTGMILGTPAYMAPEQARGEKVDGRADLFSLGVLLYRMCAGKVPFQGKDMVSTLMAVAMHEPAPPDTVNPEVPPGLSALVMQLLAKDPARRTGSAQEVVNAILALEKDLNAGATMALPPDSNVAAALARPRRRRRTGCLLLVLLLLVAIGIPVGLAATGQVDFEKLWHELTNPDRVAQENPVHPGPSGEAGTKDKDGLPNVQSPVIAGPPRLRSTLEHRNGVRALAFTPDGKRLLSGAAQATDGLYLKFFDPGNGSIVREQQPGGPIALLSVSADGKVLAVGGQLRARDNHFVRVMALPSGERIVDVPCQGSDAYALALSPDGKTLAYAGAAGVINLHDVPGGNERAGPRLDKGTFHALQFSPDGRYLVAGTTRSLQIYHAGTLELIAENSNTGSCRWVAISRDSTKVVLGGLKLNLPWQLFTLPGGDLVHREPNPVTRCEAGAFSPDGHYVALGLHDGTVQVWDVQHGKTAALWAAHAPGTEIKIGGTSAVAFSPDGATLATGGADGLIKLWDLTATAAVAREPPPWQPLFNGKDLAGWEPVGIGTWIVNKDIVRCDGPGTGWLATQRDYTDFELELSYRLGPRGNSGVFVHAWKDGAVNGGQFLEVQLVDDEANNKSAGTARGTAAIHTIVAPKVTVRSIPGIWHKLTVRARGRRLEVFFENARVLDANLDDYRDAFQRVPGLEKTSGRIGLQHYGTTVEFRGGRLRPLPPARGS